MVDCHNHLFPAEKVPRRIRPKASDTCFSVSDIASSKAT